MTDKNDKSDIHGLVMFDEDPSSNPNNNDENRDIKSIDQKDKIKLISELVPFGATYRYSILIVNQSAAPITEVKIRILYPDFLDLIRYSPPDIVVDSQTTGNRGELLLKISYHKLSENSQKQYNFYFIPSSNKNVGVLSTDITFVNNQDFVRVLNSDPVEIKIEEVSIIQKLIPGEEIQKFLGKPGIKKAVKSIGIGNDIHSNINIYFIYIDQIIRMNDFQFIAKNEEKKIVWFFGTEVNSNEDVLIIGQITSRKIEFLAASNNHPILISILSRISGDFQKRLLSSINLNIEEIYDLTCKHCGNILPFFPAKGETIKCNKCQKGQQVW